MLAMVNRGGNSLIRFLENYATGTIVIIITVIEEE